MTFIASLEETDGIVYLDWTATGDYYYSSEYILQDFSVNHQVSCAYKKSTGVVQGTHIKGTVEGQMDMINDPVTETLVPADITFSYDSHAELVGFDLPDFDESGNGGTDFSFSLPGFTWVAGVGAISFTVISLLIVRKKK